jgi:KaiC/GvpD/RAD55 family RecA-like ATPase
MDIIKELDQNHTCLGLVPSIEYNNIIVNMAWQLSKKSVCYVTLNKTYDSLKELFEKKGVNMKNMVFIDAISKTIKKIDDNEDNCYYVSSPSALTEISLAISKFLKHDFDYLIFDSLTNLTVYEKNAPVAKFLSSLINKINETKTRAIFYTINMGEQSELIKEVSMFVDNTLNLENTG